jgi:hypothetical protein
MIFSNSIPACACVASPLRRSENYTNPNSLGPDLVQIWVRISETIHFELGAISVLFSAHQNEYE